LTGFEATRSGPHHAIFGSSYGVYGTADGAALFLGQITRDEDWRALCEHGGRPGLAGDARWATTLRRIGLDPSCTIDDDLALQEAVGDLIGSRPLPEWTEFFDKRPEMIAEPVRSLRQVLDDPQVRANGMVADVDLPGVGSATVLGALVGLSETPATLKGAPPPLGADTEALYRELGHGDHDVAALATETTDAIARRSGSLKFQPPSDDS
jgi:crotonobetainyl-CoA:carnitine CoA-transferase CaiB-like acyl-CoA transferase